MSPSLPAGEGPNSDGRKVEKTVKPEEMADISQGKQTTLKMNPPVSKESSGGSWSRNSFLLKEPLGVQGVLQFPDICPQKLHPVPLRVTPNQRALGTAGMLEEDCGNHGGRLPLTLFSAGPAPWVMPAPPV